jgi:FkbM family methyltransferase
VKLEVGEVELIFRHDDQMLHNAVPEVLGPYAFDEIDFAPGDVVIDVGAHRGIVSMYLAKLHPRIRVLAYEPIKENFQELQWAIQKNKLTRRVKAYRKAVTADGRDVRLYYGTHSGEGGEFHRPGHLQTHEFEIVPSVQLDSILRKHRLDRVKLLKLDCEGAEHEIIAKAKATGILRRFEHIRGELHMTPILLAQGWTNEATEAAAGRKAKWQICATAYS